jgi:hypothetical protein
MPTMFRGTSAVSKSWHALLRTFARRPLEVLKMGRGILLRLLGIPLPIVILLVLFLR